MAIPPGTNEDIAERTKQERAARGWSLRELERRLAEAGEPMSFSLLQRFESGGGHGRTRPQATFDQARALAEVFGIDFDEFTAPAKWIQHRKRESLKRELRASAAVLEAALVRYIATARDLEAAFVEDARALIDQRSEADFVKLELSIPTAAGLQEYLNRLVAAALTLGFGLAHEAHNQTASKSKFPNMDATWAQEELGSVEGPAAPDDDWSSYLSDLAQAVNDFIDDQQPRGYKK